MTSSYPRILIEEDAGGDRTITAVATSVTAFLGTAPQGPTDEAVRVVSLSGYTGRFGPLDPAHAMGFAVRDFFLNGGSEAVICRLYRAPDHASGCAGLTLPPGLGLVARSPGRWGDALLARVDHTVSPGLAESWGLTEADLFTLHVRLGPDGPLETFADLTVKGSPRVVDRVIEAESLLVRVADPSRLPPTRPDATPAPAAGADPWEEADSTVRVDVPGADGLDLTDDDYTGDRGARTGKYLLDGIDLVNLVCVPGGAPTDDVTPSALGDLLAYCVERRAFLVVDSPSAWTHDDLVTDPDGMLATLGLEGTAARNAAIYYPRTRTADPAAGGLLATFPTCGAVAGVIARTDVHRGVWKAPAGTGATLTGILGLADTVSDEENGVLTRAGVNALRTFPTHGTVVWGARTMRGADEVADEFKYVPVRRTALFLEESLIRGLRWVVFEPNAEPLWVQIRLHVGEFLHSLFRQGAFQGTTPSEAYFVTCDADTTTPVDQGNGIVNIVVGFAPLRRAEFVVVTLRQSTS